MVDWYPHFDSQFYLLLEGEIELNVESGEGAASGAHFREGVVGLMEDLRLIGELGYEGDRKQEKEGNHNDIDKNHVGPGTCEEPGQLLLPMPEPPEPWDSKQESEHLFYQESDQLLRQDSEHLRPQLPEQQVFQELKPLLCQEPGQQLCPDLEQLLSQEPEQLLAQASEQLLYQTPEQLLYQELEHLPQQVPDQLLSLEPEELLSQEPEELLSPEPEELLSPESEELLSQDLGHLQPQKPIQPCQKPGSLPAVVQRPQHKRERSQQIRCKLVSWQLEELEHVFQKIQYPNFHMRRYLAGIINATEVRVKSWFKNRRVKYRKMMKKTMNSDDKQIHLQNENLEEAECHPSPGPK